LLLSLVSVWNGLAVESSLVLVPPSGLQTLDSPLKTFLFKKTCSFFYLYVSLFLQLLVLSYLYCNNYIVMCLHCDVSTL